MSIKILPVDSTFPMERMIEFCRKADDDQMPAAENMSVEDWEIKTNTLLYLIYKEKRFEQEKKARYKVIEVDGEIIAGGGYYPLSGDPNICLLSTRTYTIPTARQRMWHAEFLLPQNLEEIKTLNYKVGLFVFNEYNLWLRKFIQRIDEGLGAVFGYEHASIYKGWESLKHPITIQNTKQWGLYRILDPGYRDQFLKVMADLAYSE